MKITNMLKGILLAVMGALLGTIIIVLTDSYFPGLLVTFVLAVYAGTLSAKADE